MDSFDNFRKVKILVIGDVMIDRYLWGDVSRISPEAPVPVVRLKNTNLIAGGAANVAANIAGLGAVPYLFGLIGDDPEGRLFPEVLAASSISADYLVEIKNRQTTIKTRIIAHSQQIARVDQETLENLSEEQEEQVWQKLEGVLDEVGVIIISDYNKGFLGENLVSRLIKMGKEKSKIIMVDPKGKDYTKYRGASIMTPNKFEVAEVCHLNGEGEKLLDSAGQALLSKLNLEALLITKGEDGMTLLEAGREPFHLNALARKVYDVTGAGDTVIATLAVAVGSGESFRKSAEIANMAAGLVVEEVGTTTIKIENLKELLNKNIS
jgi:rfaE bifunctional protein kinase chain/domain